MPLLNESDKHFIRSVILERIQAYSQGSGPSLAEQVIIQDQLTDSVKQHFASEPLKRFPAINAFNSLIENMGLGHSYNLTHHHLIEWIVRNPDGTLDEYKKVFKPFLLNAEPGIPDEEATQWVAGVGSFFLSTILAVGSVSVIRSGLDSLRDVPVGHHQVQEDSPRATPMSDQSGGCYKAVIWNALRLVSILGDAEAVQLVLNRFFEIFALDEQSIRNKPLIRIVTTLENGEPIDELDDLKNMQSVHLYYGLEQAIVCGNKEALQVFQPIIKQYPASLICHLIFRALMTFNITGLEFLYENISDQKEIEMRNDPDFKEKGTGLIASLKQEAETMYGMPQEEVERFIIQIEAAGLAHKAPLSFLLTQDNPPVETAKLTQILEQDSPPIFEMPPPLLLNNPTAKTPSPLDGEVNHHPHNVSQKRCCHIL